MDQHARHHYDIRFERDFLKNKGNAFQDLFYQLMQKRYPGDFIPTKPWGKMGDKKNDGYLKSGRVLFQIYAPDEIKAAAATKKIEEDFNGALPFWKGYFERWVFVHNSKGLGPEVLKKLLALERSHPQIKVEQWGFEELRQEFWKLPDHEIVAWFGPGLADETPRVSFVFDRENEYPDLRFSLVNCTAAELQVTKLRAVRASTLKDERTHFRFFLGPRIPFRFNLQEARVGYPIELFGRDTVSKLGPGESEALRVEVRSQNVINLVDFEAEVLSSRQQTTNASLPHSVFVVRGGECKSDDEPDTGQICELPRVEAIGGLYDSSVCCKAAEDLDVPPEFLQMLLLRGAAFLCRGELWGHFVELRKLYEGKDGWGSVLASFAEYHTLWEPISGLLPYLEEWLISPDSVGRVMTWDIESRPVIVFNTVTRCLASDLATALCLKILDRTLGFQRFVEIPNHSDIDGSLDELSVQLVRQEALSWLYEHHRCETVSLGVVLSILSGVDRAFVSRIFDREAEPFHFPTVGASLREQQQWVDSHPIKLIACTGPPWAESLPRTCAAISARCGAEKLQDYANHEDIFLRSQLALNPHVQSDTLKKLASDRSVFIRRAVARRPDISAEIAEILSKDSDEVVQHWLARSVKT